MQKKWFLKKEKTNDNIKGLSPVLLKILSKRGYNKEEEIKSFLYGTLDDLNDPFLLTDMEKAVSRILRAIKNDEKIIIFGDYDVDGITSTTLLYRYFKENFDYNLDFYLPNRQKEGYGLNKEALTKFAKEKYDLLITVDCGITGIKEVEYANSEGIDVIITDHHQPTDSIPKAIAVIDPHRQGDNYPFKYLAGVGVAFKLCQALEYEKNKQYINQGLIDLLDIVTLGTVADIVTLTAENRILVKKGLEIINNTENIGLKNLIDQVGLNEKEITTGHIGYIIAPHLNAAGRVSDPATCIELLTTNDNNKAEHIVSDLRRINKERQDLEQRILDEAKEMVENQINLETEKAIILASENWHHGVIGIVASRLVEQYYRPTILIAVDKGVGKGSCRSINGLNIYQVLSECSNYLDSFGGHNMAAGLTIDPANLAEFRRSFNSFLNSCLSNEDMIPSLKLDAFLNQEDITMNFYQQLNLLEPYGMGNSRPNFILNNAKIDKAYLVGKNKNHLKFSLSDGLDGIGFGFGDKITDFKNSDLDIAFQLDLNEWQGNKKVQLSLKDYNIRSQCGYFPVYFQHNGCTIADKRGCQDYSGYIEQLLCLDHKIAIYINDFKIYYEILKKKKFKKENIFLADNLANFNKLMSLDEGIIFFTTSMLKKFTNIDNEKQNDLKIDDIIFLSLPFSLKEMRDAISFFARNNPESTTFHLLYSEKQLKINRHIIKRSLPSDKYLRKLYLYIKALSTENLLIENLKNIISSDKKINANQRMIKRSLDILVELGLLQLDDCRIEMLPGPTERLDLSNSISYNNYIEVITKFNQFVDLALSGDLFMLVEEINKQEVK